MKEFTALALRNALTELSPITELGSAFLCNIAGIDHNIENTAAYLKSWLTVLENNPSWITWAASRAQKACEYIIPSMASVEKVAA